MANRPTYVPDHSGLTAEVFDDYLRRILAKLPGDWCLSIPGVAELVGEELNNAVIEAWDDDHPQEARPRVFGSSRAGGGIAYSYRTDGEFLDDDEMLALAAEAERTAGDAVANGVFRGRLSCELVDGRTFNGSWWTSRV